MTRKLKIKLSCNQHNYKIKVCEKFGIKIPKSTRGAIMMYRTNNNTIWVDDITKDISSLERIGVFKQYTRNKSLKIMMVGERAQMMMIFDITIPDLRQKARLFIGGHVV